jgi:hypothetical protein
VGSGPRSVGGGAFGSAAVGAACDHSAGGGRVGGRAPTGLDLQVGVCGFVLAGWLAGRAKKVGV